MSLKENYVLATMLYLLLVREYFLFTEMLFYKQDESKNRLTLRHFINLPAGDLKSEPK